MKNFNKKTHLAYICIVISSLLALMLVSQNCASKNNGTNVFYQTQELTDPIIFKVKHNKIISDILWQVRVHHYNKHQIAGCYTDLYEKMSFKKTDFNIEVDRDNILQMDSTLGINAFVQAFIQFEDTNCITYRKKSFQLISPSSTNMDIVCQQAAVLPPHINPISSMDPTSPHIIESIRKSLYHFPIGDSIDLELVSLRNENSQFTWSIKNMEDDIELADQDHQDTTLTHTFSEKGIYNISAIEKNTNFEISTQLLIGQCEITDITEEIVMDTQSSSSN